jgi:hypothetical protein
MLKAIGFCVKMAFFSLFILFLGSWLRWDGKTLSDQIKLHMSHTERSDIFDSMRSWATKITEEVQAGSQKKSKQSTDEEEISSSERQKLKALIRELNHSHKKD